MNPEIKSESEPQKEASISNPAAPILPDAEEKAVHPIVVTGAESDAALRVGDLPGKATREGNSLLNIFLPNRYVPTSAMAIVALVEAGIFLLCWFNTPYAVLPKPGEVLSALQNLWMTQGLGQELPVSFGLNLYALLWSTLISLGLAYLTVIPVFRPLVAAISKGRFLSLAGFSFILTQVGKTGEDTKVILLTFSVTVFYVTSMAAVIAAIPRSEFDHARTLRMSEWRVVLEVVILGTLDKVFEVLRQNAAIGWMMLTMVEGISRSQGGIGVMLLTKQKHLQIPDLFAIQLLILIVGLVQDYGIEFIRRMVCPHANLTLERK